VVIGGLTLSACSSGAGGITVTVPDELRMPEGGVAKGFVEVTGGNVTVENQTLSGMPFTLINNCNHTLIEPAKRCEFSVRAANEPGTGSIKTKIEGSGKEFTTTLVIE
jgi:hypothetical protein